MRSGLQRAHFHAHSTAAGLLIGARVVTSRAGFKGESPGRRGSAGALAAGAQVGVAARVAGPEGAAGEEPRTEVKGLDGPC